MDQLFTTIAELDKAAIAQERRNAELESALEIKSKEVLLLQQKLADLEPEPDSDWVPPPRRCRRITTALLRLLVALGAAVVLRQADFTSDSLASSPTQTPPSAFLQREALKTFEAEVALESSLKKERSQQEGVSVDLPEVEVKPKPPKQVVESPGAKTAQEAGPTPSNSRSNEKPRTSQPEETSKKQETRRGNMPEMAAAQRPSPPRSPEKAEVPVEPSRPDSEAGAPGPSEVLKISESAREVPDAKTAQEPIPGAKATRSAPEPGPSREEAPSRREPKRAVAPGADAAPVPPPRPPVPPKPPSPPPRVPAPPGKHPASTGHEDDVFAAMTTTFAAVHLKKLEDNSSDNNLEPPEPQELLSGRPCIRGVGGSASLDCRDQDLGARLRPSRGDSWTMDYLEQMLQQVWDRKIWESETLESALGGAMGLVTGLWICWAP